MGFKVFISHSLSDLTLVSQFKYCLEHNKVGVYLAELDPQPGQDLSDKVKEAIQQSDYLLALLTADGLRSQWVSYEIAHAEAKGKPVMPIVEEGMPVPGFLAGKEYIPLDRRFPERTLIKATDFLIKKKAEKESRDNLIAGLLIFLGLWALSKK